MGYTIEDILNEADILTTDVANGEVRANLGDSTDGSGFAQDIAIFGSDGFISRPNDSDARGSVQAYYLNSGQSRVILGTRDNRFSSAVGAMKPGDRAIVTDGPTRFLMKRDTAVVSLYTESKNETTGKSIILSLDGTTDKITIQNGDAFFIMKRDEIQMGVSGGALLTLNKTGAFKVIGKSTALATAAGTLGVTGGAPPLPGPNSIIGGVSGVAGVPSASWTVAPA